MTKTSKIKKTSQQKKYFGNDKFSSKKEKEKREKKKKIVVPTTKDITMPNHKMTDEEFAIFKERFDRFKDTYAFENAICTRRLGYDINYAIAVDGWNTVKSLKTFVGSNLQPFNMPMKAKIVKELLSCKKFPVKRTSFNVLDIDNRQRKCFATDYIGITTLGCVHFSAQSFQEVDRNNELTKNFSTSFYVALQGETPMFLYRHDNQTQNFHFQRFTEEGQLTRNKLYTLEEFRNKFSGAHEHAYNFAYSVVFASKGHLEHGDIKPARQYNNCLEFEEDFNERFNIIDHRLKINQEKTIMEAAALFMEQEAMLKKQTQSKEEIL